MVRVRQAEGMVTVMVEDDGCGIAAGTGASWGILGMRERSRSLDGTLTVAPRPGGGTVVTLRMPVEVDHGV
jgi:two-component system sensor histidine kinase UhpB